MTNTFIWSDLHVGHVHLAENWRPSFGGTVPLHDAHIKQVWNDVVGVNDEVWIVGDEAMGQRAITVPWIGENLNGTKHLIPGNHSKVHEMYGAHAKKLLPMFESVFVIHENVVDGKVFGIPNMIMCHFPWAGTPDHESSDRDLQSWYPKREDHLNTVLVHGHTHSHEKISSRAIHVGVDAWPNGPIELSVIERMVADSLSRSE